MRIRLVHSLGILLVSCVFSLAQPQLIHTDVVVYEVPVVAAQAGLALIPIDEQLQLGENTSIEVLGDQKYWGGKIYRPTTTKSLPVGNQIKL